METVRVVEVISELERIWEPVAEAYPVFPDFQLDLLVTFHAEELLSAVTSALVQEEVLPLWVKKACTVTYHKVVPEEFT